MKYFLIAGVLFVYSQVSAAGGLDVYSVLVLPPAVAIYAARGRVNSAMGLIAVCGLGALTAGRSTEGALQYALVAMAGVPIALGVTRRWTYGKTLAAVAATASVAIVGGILADWTDWLALTQAGYQAFLDSFMSGYQGEVSPELLDSMREVGTRLAEVGVGASFAQILALSCLVQWLTLRTLQRRYRITGMQGSFRTARVSEWLVWAAILVAGLWFAEQQWPSAGLRVVIWNAAIGLAAIYWLNGLSVLLYGLEVLSPGFFGYTLVILLMVSFGFYPVCLIGLFDTWGNFRNVFDRIAAERKRREQAEHADDQ